MNKNRIFILFLFLPVILFGTTWVDVDITCPICGTKNTFEAVASYGNYIYGDRSRFQLVFFPFTSDEIVYTCKHCRFSAFPEDFENVPASQTAVIRTELEQLPLPESLRERNESSYTDTPTWARLVVAERLYKLVERDQEFWCHFFRVLGYHAAESSQFDLAKKSRGAALRIADELLSNEDITPRQKKELLIVRAAMSHYTGNDDEALEYLRKAQSVKHPQVETEEYYREFIPEYIDKLTKKEQF